MRLTKLEKQQQHEELQERKGAAIKSLAKLLKNKTVFLLGVGWNRNTGGRQKVFIFAVIKGEVKNISAPVSDATGYEWHDDGSLNASCTTEVVHQLSYALYGTEGGLKIKYKNL